MTTPMTFDTTPVKQDTSVPSQAPQASAMTFDSSPVQQDTNIDSTGQVAAPTFWDRVKSIVTGIRPDDIEAMSHPPKYTTSQQLEGAAKGAGKSALQTLSTIGDIATLGLTHLLPGSENAGASLKSSDDNEAGGAMTEQAVEYALGEGVFKALGELPLTERLSQTSQIMKLAQKYPALKNIILAGTKGAAVGGTVGGIHGGVEGAEEGAALGAAGNIVGEGIGALKSGETPVVADTAQPDAANTNPIEQKISDATSKAPISEGLPETVAPDESTVQAPLQQNVRQAFADAAKDAEITPSTSDAPLRNSASDMAAQIKDRSSAAYKTLDEASGGQWQRFDKSIDNLRTKADELAGIDDEKANTYSEQADTIEKTRDEMVKQLVNDGTIDANTADQAVSNWSQQKALTRVDRVLKSYTRPPTNTQSETITNPQALERGLQRLYDDPKQILQRALGEDNANALLEHVRNASDAMTQIKEFEPQSATGKQMLKNIVQRNASAKSSVLRGGKIVANIDWNGVVRDFENLGAQGQRAAFGSEVPQTRQFIQRQALKQNAAGVLRPRNLVGAMLGKHYLYDPIKGLIEQ